MLNHQIFATEIQLFSNPRYGKLGHLNDAKINNIFEIYYLLQPKNGISNIQGQKKLCYVLSELYKSTYLDHFVQN